MQDFVAKAQPAPRAAVSSAMRHEMKAAIVAALLQAEGQGDEQTASELLTILKMMPDKAIKFGRNF